MRAQRVAVIAQDRAPAVTSYAESQVRVASLLAADMENTRWLVLSALGELAADTEQAARLHLHKNTVKYGVDKAAQVRGAPLDKHRLDLELALIACRFPGEPVLTAPSRRPRPKSAAAG
ncbi:helix-turn-helix domain-containing protein [Streptomyces sp. NPDC052494]|uniref:helix-turn-helix domain-containing protein n=1 Tax=Streptomyces sp. NPDC052494 TaxID=3365692 RepID=UPI0037D54A7D